MRAVADIDALAAINAAAQLLERGRSDLPATLLHSRARLIAARAIKDSFPDMTWKEVAAVLGEKPASLQVRMSNGRGARWWNDEIVNELVGMFIGPSLGERAK